MERNALSSRLGDSALRKVQQTTNPFSSLQDASQSSQKLRNVVNALGAASFLSKLS